MHVHLSHHHGIHVPPDRRRQHSGRRNAVLPLRMQRLQGRFRLGAQIAGEVLNNLGSVTFRRESGAHPFRRRRRWFEAHMIHRRIELGQEVVGHSLALALRAGHGPRPIRCTGAEHPRSRRSRRHPDRWRCSLRANACRGHPDHLNAGCPVWTRKGPVSADTSRDIGVNPGSNVPSPMGFANIHDDGLPLSQWELHQTGDHSAVRHPVRDPGVAVCPAGDRGHARRPAVVCGVHYTAAGQWGERVQ